MRATIDLDDDLVARATAFTGVQEPAALVAMALRMLVERESGRRLARLGGTEPNMASVRRR